MSADSSHGGGQGPLDADAPYLDAVAAYVEGSPARFHVPGHKGGPGADPQVRAMFGERALAHDVPQDLEGIDVGPSPTPAEQAELLAARCYRAAQSWFLTNGATQGNHALCLALARERPVVVQRNSHASVVDGLVLSGGRPDFAVPEYDDELAMALCVTPQALAEALARAPGAQAAIIVSPTYYGATADVAACAGACHRAGAALIVDQAWGPHFGFHPGVPPAALAEGADAMLTSTHKIAGSMTQSAMLHVADTPWLDRARLGRAVRLVRSTSPSSLLLGSLDGARRQLQVDGEALLERTLGLRARACAQLAQVPGCRVVPGDARWSSVAAWDPMRIVLDVRGTGASGHEVAAALRRHGAWCELATHATVVFVLGIGERPAPLERLPSLLEKALGDLGGPGHRPALSRAPLPASGEPAMTPREAWLAGTERVPVAEAVGRVSAEAIAGYPPGIPAVVPGERLTAAVVAHLRELAVAGVHLHGASDQRLDTVVVTIESAARDAPASPSAATGSADSAPPPSRPAAGPPEAVMPAEWEPHERCLMGWPARAELWGENAERARRDYAKIARAIAAHEPVLMLARPADADDAAARCGETVEILPCELDDSWLRDTGPLFVRTRSSEGELDGLAGVDFAFNGWGGKYRPYDADAEIPRCVLEQLGLPRRSVDLVLEGGAITVDGEGTLITTESVLLNPNRNPAASRTEIEAVLRRHLGAVRVIWLAGGLVEDRDTDGHVDNVCQFLAPGRVLVQTARDPRAPNHAVCSENLRRLRAATDALGRSLEIVEMRWLPYLAGEEPAVVAPYVNLYLANEAAIVPVTGHEDDERALALLARELPGRTIVPVPGQTLARGGGGVHCITQQQPAAGGRRPRPTR